MNKTTALSIEKVPDEAVISPKDFSGLKLVGYYVPPECRTITERNLLYVETYWTIEKLLAKNFSLSITAAPVRECLVPPYKCPDHEFSKHMRPGVIYRERIGLLPPKMDQLANLNLQVSLKVMVDKQVIGEFKDPALIDLRFPKFRHYDTKFDDIIYKMEPGKCWTAEQIEKVTGGEWIVPPPKGWYVKSFSELSDTIGALMPRPTLFLSVATPSQDSHAKILENVRRLDGAIISHDVEGLPADFPLLKVKDTFHAIYQIGFAARERFQGKVIAVTGSAGKTTTCNMLKYVLGKDHKVTATVGTTNAYIAIPWNFAHVQPQDAYAIIEMGLPSLNGLRGSITYDIKPNLAVVTSIAPAHIGKVGSLETLARGKSKIFCGMPQGSYVILNRDMPCYEIFEQKANSLKLNIITFGTHPDAFVRMPVLKNDGEFSIMGETYKLFCPVPSEQLYDALAVVAVSVALGVSVEKTLEYLKTFTPVSGRGNILKSFRKGKNLKIINSAYNANPISMKYALQHLKTVEPNPKNRVAILGDIAELGSGSIDYHKELAEIMLDTQIDRILLCGEFMHHPYELIKDKANCTWFSSLDDLLKDVENYLHDGDTILIKSSHATGLSKVVALLSQNESTNLSMRFALNVPKPLFDIKDFLPEGITPEHNGKMPPDRLKKIHCGGCLYIDAARSWLAMVRAAAQENVFLNLNNPINAYREFERQLGLFKKRFVPVSNPKNLTEGSIRVEFDNKIWQLKPNMVYAAVPGQSSHGYGLAVDIVNSGLNYVKIWLNKNAHFFGFVREYDFEPWHFTYIRGQKSIPKIVLDIENFSREPTYSAEQIEQVSGYKWFTPPPEDWTCNGIFYSRPLRAGFLVAVDQGQGLGISMKLLNAIFRQMAGLICVNPEPLLKFNLPILATSNLADTVEKLSEFCVPEKFQIIRKT